MDFAILKKKEAILAAIFGLLNQPGLRSGIPTDRVIHWFRDFSRPGMSPALQPKGSSVLIPGSKFV